MWYYLYIVSITWYIIQPLVRLLLRITNPQLVWYHLHRFELCNDPIQFLVGIFSLQSEYISPYSVSTFTAYIQKLLDKPAWCHIASAPSTIVCWNLSACQFCCGVSGMDVWYSIPFSAIKAFCSFDRNSPPQSNCLHLSVVPSCHLAHALYCLNAANSSLFFLR